MTLPLTLTESYPDEKKIVCCAPVYDPVEDKRLFVTEVEAVLSLWKYNQSVISAAHVLLLSLGPLEEWIFCTAAYVAVIKFLRGAHMCCICRYVCGHKVLFLAYVFI